MSHVYATSLILVFHPLFLVPSVPLDALIRPSIATSTRLVCNLTEVESKIAHHIQERRTRIGEFFRDFDRLKKVLLL